VVVDAAALPSESLPLAEVVAKMQSIGHSLGRFHEPSENLLSLVSVDGSRGRKVMRGNTGIVEGAVVGVAGVERSDVLVSMVTALAVHRGTAIVIVFAKFAAFGVVVSRSGHPVREFGSRMGDFARHAGVTEHSDGVVWVADGLRHDWHETVGTASRVLLGTAILVKVSPLAALGCVVSRSGPPLFISGRDRSVVSGHAGVEPNTILSRVVGIARNVRKNGLESVGAGGGFVFGATVVVEHSPLRALGRVVLRLRVVWFRRRVRMGRALSTTHRAELPHPSGDSIEVVVKGVATPPVVDHLTILGRVGSNESFGVVAALAARHKGSRDPFLK